MNPEAYLDNSATTKTDPKVAELALSMMLDHYGNPSSLHQKGLDAQLELEKAQRRVARALGVEPETIFFTSGGTEGANLAVFGATRARRRQGNRIVTTAFEHDAVLMAAKELEGLGFEVVYVAPDASGHIDPDKLADAVDQGTILVSAMLVNNEVGTKLDLEELVRKVKAKNPNTLVHCDAVQAFGKVPIHAKKANVDLLSLSGHKIHAPKGVGALYIKKGVRILPMLYGGGQQKGIRPGTENVPLACALGLAAELATTELDANFSHITDLNRQLIAGLAQIPEVVRNSPEDAIPHIVNLSVPGYRSEIMLHHLESQGVYVSSASACTGGAVSHVLTSMGLPRERVDSALRISFSKYNTAEDVQRLLGGIKSGIATLRKSR